MPIYGYACRSCGDRFETLVRASETPACPSCGSVDLAQQLSLIAKPAKGGPADAAPCGANGASCGMCCPGMAAGG